MKVHNIDLSGSIKIPEVDALPAIVASDERKFVYLSTDSKLYYSDGTQWVSMTSITDSHLIDYINPHNVTALQVGSPITVDGVGNPGGDVDLIEGDEIVITPNAGNNEITISVSAKLNSHIDNSTDTADNPHGVTAAQIGGVDGASNVGGEAEIFKDKTDETLNFKTLESSDGAVIFSEGTDKLDLTVPHIVNTSNPHSVTAAQVGGIDNGVNLGDGKNVFKEKNGESLEYRSVESSDDSILVTETEETIDLTIPSMVPPGAILMYGSGDTPSGFLSCNGAVVNRTEYPNLFYVIGTNFNTGGESLTSFRLPDLVSKFVKGSISGVGLTGGSSTISPSGTINGSTGVNGAFDTGGTTLTVAQMPAHAHLAEYGALTERGSADTPTASSSGRDEGVGNQIPTTSVGGSQPHYHSVPVHTHPVSASFAGSSQSNEPQYLQLGYIIKT